VAFRADEAHPFLGKEIAAPREFSEHTARVIDEETMRIIREAFECAVDVLRKNRDKLDRLAEALEEREELDEQAIEELIGPPAYRTEGEGKVLGAASVAGARKQ
jgi:cell division protease FtsH